MRWVSLLAVLVVSSSVQLQANSSVSGCVDMISVSQRWGMVELEDYRPPDVKVGFRLRDGNGDGHFFTFGQLGLMASGIESYVPGERFAVAVEPMLSQLRAAAFAGKKVHVIWETDTLHVRFFSVSMDEKCKPLVEVAEPAQLKVIDPGR